MQDPNAQKPDLGYSLSLYWNSYKEHRKIRIGNSSISLHDFLYETTDVNKLAGYFSNAGFQEALADMSAKYLKDAEMVKDQSNEGMERRELLAEYAKIIESQSKKGMERRELLAEYEAVIKSSDKEGHLSEYMINKLAQHMANTRFAKSVENFIRSEGQKIMAEDKASSSLKDLHIVQVPENAGKKQQGKKACCNIL